MKLQPPRLAVTGLLLLGLCHLANAMDAQTLYSRGALENQIAAIGPQIRSAFDTAVVTSHNPTQAEKAVRERIGQTIDRAFSTQAGQVAMLTELDQRLSAADREHVVAWFDSELGSTILETEQAATFSSLAEYDAFQQQQFDHPPSQSRLLLMEELDDALGSTRAGARLLMQLDIAIAVAQMGAIDEADADHIAPLGFEIPDAHAYESAVKEHVLQHHLFTFQNTSDIDLKHYIAFATSISGSRYLDAVQHGLERAIGAGTLQLAELFIELNNTPSLLKVQLEQSI